MENGLGENCQVFIPMLNSFLTPFLQVMKDETRAIWEQLFADITLFDDFRAYKAELGGNGADFRHRETGTGLW